jgi:hypothetical protein
LSVINLFLSDFRHSLTELQVKILYKSVAKWFMVVVTQRVVTLLLLLGEKIKIGNMRPH